MSDKLTLKQKIIAISNELRVQKEGKNSFANYEYFKPDDINRLINPLLQKYDILILFNLEMQNDFYRATLTVEDAKEEQNRVYTMDIDKAVVKGANPAQNSGATMTYAKRYLMMNVFNIADNGADFDSDNMSQKTYTNPAKTTPPIKKTINPVLKTIHTSADELGVSINAFEKLCLKHYKKAAINMKPEELAALVKYGKEKMEAES